MINEIFCHFDEIGVDVVYSDDDYMHSFEFVALFNEVEAQVIITVDLKKNILSCLCQLTNFMVVDLDLYNAINLFNQNSNYFSASYNDIYEMVLLKSKMFFTSSNILYLIDLMLDSLISKDIAYIENINNYSTNGLTKEDIELIEEMLEEDM